MTTETPPAAAQEPSEGLLSLAVLPSTPASLLALASRINAVEQLLSFEAAQSPPVFVTLPPLPANTPAAPSTSSTRESSSRRSLRDSLPSSPPDAPPSLSFLSKVTELNAALQPVEDETVQELYSLYSQYETLLSSTAASPASSLSSFLASAAVKQQLLLSQYDTLMAAQQQLTALSSLLPSITPPPLSLTEQQLSAVEAEQRERLKAAAVLHVAADRFLTAYTDCVDGLNGALVRMDTKLRRWERMVDAAADTGQSPAR
jgi:hypothetical protein